MPAQINVLIGRPRPWTLIQAADLPELCGRREGEFCETSREIADRAVGQAEVAFVIKELLCIGADHRPVPLLTWGRFSAIFNDARKFLKHSMLLSDRAK